MAANGVSGPHGMDQTGVAAAVPPNVDLGQVTFGSVLRALNPLQYLPVVGTIYRVATGDAAPSGLRMAVSAVAGVVTGGPIGLLGSIVGSIAEQFLHVEDHIRQALNPAHGPAPAVPPTATAPAHDRAPVQSGQVPAPHAGATAVTAYRAAELLGTV